MALRGKGESLPSSSVLAAASALLPVCTVFITTLATACTVPASAVWVFTDLPRITPSLVSKANILAGVPESKEPAAPARAFPAAVNAARAFPEILQNGPGVSGSSNQNIGVYGTSNDPNVGSIWGDSQINVGAGVVGNSTNGYAIWGQSFTDATKLEGGGPYANVGVLGLADRGNGVLGYAGIGAAVAGVSTDPQGFAGSFDGNVTVTGTIFKGSSNFRIDHPLDPANKYLTHAAVESDAMKNFYDGMVKLNGKGQAEVRLPRWFSSVNRELRYQLTSIGAAAPDLHIASALRDGKFRIAGGRPGLRVCWQVTGIRNDKWARKNPLVVEAPKARHHRGKYLHPKVRGKKKEQAIGWIALPKPRIARGPS